jgi:hypothetical protein
MSAYHATGCAKALDHSKACNCSVGSPRLLHFVGDALNGTLCERCSLILAPEEMRTNDESIYDKRTDRCSSKFSERGISTAVDHPSHYGGKDNVYETIKVIDAWQLGFALGNAVKYLSRAGKKDPAKEIEDLQKAVFYINHRIEQLKAVKK